MNFIKSNRFFIFSIIFISYWLSSKFIMSANGFMDESNILIPIRENLTGLKWPVREYPDFPYLFYKYFFISFSSVFENLGLYPFARTLNALLFPLNAFLFYKISKKYLKGIFLTIACFFFCFSPGIVFSSVALKTESLTLLEFLLTIFFTQKFMEKKEGKWAILAGLSAALGISTKYYVMFPIVFLSGYFLTIDSNISLKKRFKEIIWSKFTLLFFLALITSIFLSWPSIWEVFDTFSSLRLKDDLYFTDGPTSYKAVAELWSFPHGRYSQAFIFCLPMNVGILIYFMGLLGLFLRQVPKEVVFLFGGSTFFYLLLVLNFTMLRPLYLFTICAPFFIISSAFFIQYIFKKIETWPKYLVILPLIIFSLFESKNLAIYYSEYTFILGDVVSTFQREWADNNTGPIPEMLTLHQVNDYTSVKPTELKSHLEKGKAEYILVHKALGDNFCKYKNNITYREICNLYKSLLKEEMGYKVYWQRPLNIKINLFNLDPEYSSDFYLMKKG